MQRRVIADDARADGLQQTRQHAGGLSHADQTHRARPEFAAGDAVGVFRARAQQGQQGAQHELGLGRGGCVGAAHHLDADAGAGRQIDVLGAGDDATNRLKIRRAFKHVRVDGDLGRDQHRTGAGQRLLESTALSGQARRVEELVASIEPLQHFGL